MVDLEKLCEAIQKLHDAKDLMNAAVTIIERTYIRLELSKVKVNIEKVEDETKRTKLNEALSGVEEFLCEEAEK